MSVSLHISFSSFSSGKQEQEEGDNLTAVMATR